MRRLSRRHTNGMTGQTNEQTVGKKIITTKKNVVLFGCAWLIIQNTYLELKSWGTVIAHLMM